MSVKRITITGADDTITPNDLINLSTRYPMVEWGICLSEKKSGSGRFPSDHWIIRLKVLSSDRNMFFSGHLYDRWSSNPVDGNGFSFYKDNQNACSLFLNKRFQFNFESKPILNQESFLNSLKQFPTVQYIIKFDGANDYLYDILKENGVTVVPLFTLPLSVSTVNLINSKGIRYCGFSGEFNTGNVLNQYENIEKQLPGMNYWINVDNNMRSINDRQFDVQKADEFLKVASNI